MSSTLDKFKPLSVITKKKISDLVILGILMIGISAITITSVNSFFPKNSQTFLSDSNNSTAPISSADSSLTSFNNIFLQENMQRIRTMIWLVVFVILFITLGLVIIILRNRIWFGKQSLIAGILLKYYLQLTRLKLSAVLLKKPKESLEKQTKDLFFQYQLPYPFIKNLSVFQQGSALIITLLVITVVSAMIFSTGTLALKELKLTTQLEESDQAYYAAESGIEIGLLAFRFSREFETSENATKEEVEPIRFDLTDTDTSSASEKSTFDLKGYYRSDENFICVPENSCDENDNPIFGFTSAIPALAKDQTVEYDLSGVDGNLSIEWEYDREPIDDLDEQKMLLEYTVYDKEGKIESINQKDAFPYSQRNFNPTIPVGNNPKTLRLKSWGANITNYKIKIEEFSDDKLDTRYTTIESTGYYGGTKRKLQITLDRTTGTLLGLHDFALFGSSGISANP